MRQGNSQHALTGRPAAVALDQCLNLPTG